MEGSEAQLEGSEGQLEGSEGQPRGKDKQTDERTHGRKISPFYRTLSPTAAQKESGKNTYLI